MKNTSLRLGAVAGCVAAAAMLSGCGPDAGSPTPSAVAPAAPTPVTAPTSVAAPGSTAPAAAAQATGSGGGVNITLTVPGSTAITLGGDALAFDFTLTNPSATATAQPVGVVAAMGHCSCGPSGAHMSPQGTMQLLDPSTGTWKQVTFVREGTGMDYLLAPVVPSVTLAPGQSITYHMKVRLQQDPAVNYTAGSGSLNVTLEEPGTGLKALGQASVPITVRL
ncbi:hypothetical protein VMT65_24600 [Nocardia sp. CDC153]|uniref:hypothetical protein n=1 Tax=Nocardia sp. CDC153 TaxID=3112167 RepID=UPI002DBA25BC|nr:hypothetical protein [Nocardia sp. CDC153]MEC3956241.1 hypothetical protein [Nocardia sp. CDC153]